MSAESKLPPGQRLAKRSRAARESAEGEGPRLLPGVLLDWSCAGPIGGGIWAISLHKVLEGERTILLALAGSDVALLAVIFAAVALMGSFPTGAVRSST